MSRAQAALLKEAIELLDDGAQLPFKDTAHHERVKRLGEEIGFGAMMHCATLGWREANAERGHPVGGEFTVGHTRIVVEKFVERAKAALETAADQSPGIWNTPAIRSVMKERKRQIEKEGWTPEHDDEHWQGDLARAGACYAVAYPNSALPINWPWETHWWKPKDRRSNLVRAGALILAEIERLDRKEPTTADES